MRIAVSGTHAAGKSTLIAELAKSLPNYVTFEEPYHTLASLGHTFADAPTSADFELLLRESCGSLTRTTTPSVLFDRCPADYYAYLLASDRHAAANNDIFADVADAIARLDLVVFVPIERPDRIAVDASESPKLRRRVDRSLRELLVDDAWGLGVPTIEVNGSPTQRAAQVLAHIKARAANSTTRAAGHGRPPGV